MSQENGLYTFGDYYQTGLGNPNTLVRKAPIGARFVDLSTGNTYTKGSSSSSGTGWSKSVNGVPSKVLGERFVDWDSSDTISSLTIAGAVRATTGLHTTQTPGGLRLNHSALGTQTIAILASANGLDISGDQTDNDGWEITTGQTGASGTPLVVGTDGGFFFECSINAANVSGSDTMVIGLRQVGVVATDYLSYANYAAMGWNTAAAAAALKIMTGLAGTDVSTDTTETLADGVTYNIRIEVSAAGVVTFKHSQGADVATAVPTATVAYTLTDGIQVIPFLFFLQATAADTGLVTVRNWNVGLL